MDHIDALLQQLRAIESDAPVVTVTLDLTPGPEGIPGAAAVLKQGWRLAEAHRTLEHDALRSYQADQQVIEGLPAEASGRGARGLLYVGCAQDGLRMQLETPFPFRNSLYVGSRPWLFELLRYRYLIDRPVTLASVDSHSVHITRYRSGEVESTIEGEEWENAATTSHGRTEPQGYGSAAPGAADTAGGFHGKSRIEKSILAHREQFAREHAGRLQELVEADDVIIVAGPPEARSDVARQLPPALAERIIEHPALDPTLGDERVTELATEAVIERQYARAERAAEDWRSGNLGARAITGLDAVLKAIERGQLETLIMSDDAVSHLGTALDAREHVGALHADEANEALRGALAVSADVLVTRAAPEAPAELMGVLRWV